MPYDSDIIVIGCGNILFKDDGYGPIVINLLQKYFEDKKLYEDYDHIKEYIDRFLFRPLKNLITGSRDFDKEFQSLELNDFDEDMDDEDNE